MRRSYPKLFRTAGFLLVGLLAGWNVAYSEDWRQADSPTIEYTLSDSARTHEARVGAVMLQVEDCQLRVRSDQLNAIHPTGLPGACRFVVGKGGGAQVVETSFGPTLLIASFARQPDSRFCDTRVRAVVVRSNQVLISQDQQRIRSCARGPFDTKMFHVLARSAKAP